MIYHTLRLACIVISSFKTWAAVVDSEDRSQARRHMVLWLLTLAGLSVEPIVDALFSYRVPMYESLKTVVTGWLLIAHFYLSKSSDEQHEEDSDSLLPEELMHSDGDHIDSKAGSMSRTTYSPVMKTSSGNRRRDTRLDPTHQSFSTSNLDFGRFKRDLERRQSASRSSIIESEIISPSLRSRSGSKRAHHDASPAVSTTFSGHNPLEVSPAIHNKSRSISHLTVTERESFAAPTASFSFEKRLREGYEFGSEPSSRKRPLSNLHNYVSRTPSARPLPKQRANTPRTPGRRQISGNRSPLGFDTEKKEQEEVILDTRRIKRTRANSSAGDKLPSRQHGTEIDERDRRDHPTQAVSRETLRKSTTDPPLPSSSASRPGAMFSRPKPPGKNRTGILSGAKYASPVLQEQSFRQNGNLSKKTPQNHKDQRSDRNLEDADRVAGDSQLGAASLESRMKHVRDWIKKRNPSMISPSLTQTSNNTNSDRKSLSRRDTLNSNKVDSEAPHKNQKRKAHRQLVPITNPKRPASEATLHSRAQGLRETLVRTSATNPKSHQITAATAAAVHPQTSATAPTTATHLQPTRRHSSLKSPPLTRLSRNNSSDVTGLQQRDQDVLLTPPDWSRFQRPHRRRRRQQQQEEEGAFRFNDALDAWEREDDETLALNAAREAAEAEVRGQRRSAARSQQDALSSSSPSEQEAEEDEGRRRWKKPWSSPAPSSLQSESEMAAPTPGLLRAVPFNGESSRKPVPDLQGNNKYTARKTSRPGVPFSINGKNNSNTAGQHRSQPEFRGAVSLANSRQQRQQQQHRRPVGQDDDDDDESAAVRRERHPGLYTPSKKNRYLGVEDFDLPSLHKSTPASMSRYIQFSGLTDDDEESS
ncbi:hypothetical protein KVV02_003072 [Mortierella alpina]|uniref:Uncharacterized protein n=1 Tax=Mortierella alpina TaxID=64518 RepID=A0A9P8A2F4_MORAP|nr:hypothetical protein KVV02_003072 [Mortierella alpina]